MKSEVVSQKPFVPRLGQKDFDRLSNFIHTQYGIKLPPAKKTMLESRLQKRLRATDKRTFEDYCDYVFSLEGKKLELINMVDIITTNKTDFFREPAHFAYMLEALLPNWFMDYPNRKLSIWSAGCSSGEEVYTLAMVLSEFAEGNKGFLDYSILGSDLSSEVLKKAVRAIYTEEKTAGIPLALKKKYLLRAKDKTSRTVRIVPALRTKTSYMRLNFMDEAYNAPDGFDLIFCRNVLIYFDRITQENVINKLCRHLRPGGYLFLGHSESITSLQVPLKQVKPTIFCKI